jgi:hypothetical protein
MLDARGEVLSAGKEGGQRFELQIPLRYRANGDSRQCRGVTKDIGCSRVLFRGEDLAELGGPLEVSLLVLNGVIKQRAAELFCRGVVT